MRKPVSDRSARLQEIPLVSDSLRIVCLALILASAAILFRIASIW
jgi:hypothetical protein